jgi:hypothetical protein
MFVVTRKLHHDIEQETEAESALHAHHKSSAK